VLPAALKRVEFDALEEGREPRIVERALKQALMDVWRARLGSEDFSALLARFEQGLEIETADLMTAPDLLAQFGAEGRWWPGLNRVTARLGLTDESPAAAASALEFALEGLHLTKRLNKAATETPGGWRFETSPR
jgi:magnesium chelatase subunit I